jgi:outer membrane protein
MRSACVALLLLVAPRTAGADEPDAQVLDLSAVIGVAVREAPELARARYDARTARGEATRAAGALDVRVTAAARAIAFKDQPVTATIDAENEVYGFTFGLDKQLFFGTRLAVAADIFKQEANGVVGFTSGLSFSLTQPLLRGAGPGAAEGAIRQTRHAADAAQLAREASARALLVTLIQAYWDVALARRELEVRRDGVTATRGHLKYTENSIRVEKVPRSEAAAVEHAIEIRELDVLAAEQRLHDRSLALRELAGLEIDAEHIDVLTEPLPAIGRESVNLEETIAAAFANSAEIAAAEAAERAAGAGADAADGAARPRLDFEFTGGPLATAVAAGDSVRNARDGKGYSVNASLTFESSLQRRTERGGRTAARAQHARARVDVRAARARVAAAAVRAVQRLNAAVLSGKHADRAVALAAQTVESEQRRFELGRTTNFEVVRRFEDLDAAKLRQAEAIVAYLSARAEVDGLTGQVLKTHRLKLD